MERIFFIFYDTRRVRILRLIWVLLCNRVTILGELFLKMHHHLIAKMIIGNFRTNGLTLILVRVAIAFLLIHSCKLVTSSECWWGRSQMTNKFVRFTIVTGIIQVCNIVTQILCTVNNYIKPWVFFKMES